MLRLLSKTSISRRVFSVACFLSLTAISGFAQIADSAQQQIADIYNFKQSLSPAEQKLSTSLLLALRYQQGTLPDSLVQYVDLGSLDYAGRMPVDVHGAISEGIVNDIFVSGGLVEDVSMSAGQVRGHIDAQTILSLANNPDVRSIQDADQLYTNVGALTSQGYIAHTANKAFAMGVTGAGVKVGVLSDSASAPRVAALIATGDLPPDTVVVEASSGTDEGAAMMEIVHDIAPGAKLYFATANGGQPHMAANIQTLAAMGCGVIVDDITYFAEAAFQDGPIAQAVNAFVAGGGLYFSSAANSGNLTSGTSGTWEGDFADGGAILSGPLSGAGHLHNFAPGQGFDGLTAISTFISLKWSDPLGHSSNDYDLFILNSAGTTVKGFSAAAQTGTQDPFEFVRQGTNCGTASASGYCPAVGDRVVVAQFSGDARALRIDTNRGRLSVATAGSTFGHNGGPNTLTVAATYWNSARTGTRPFTGFANPVEIFSSDGPRKMFFNPDGTAITPGNFLFSTNGGQTFQKPDLTAADGVSAKTPGFLPFFGTSAAAPHAAGVAALVESANPALTGPQVKQILINTSLDNMAPGADRDGGYGIIMALPAVQAAQAPQM